jgi:pentatricopeptide repeat protein
MHVFTHTLINLVLPQKAHEEGQLMPPPRYSQLLQRLLELEHFSLAASFAKFVVDRALPQSQFTWSLVIKCLASMRDLDTLQHLYQRLRDMKQCDAMCYTTFIAVYFKCGELQLATKALEDMKGNNKNKKQIENQQM